MKKTKPITTLCQLITFALTGSFEGMSVVNIMVLLGKDEVLNRLDYVIGMTNDMEQKRN